MRLVVLVGLIGLFSARAQAAPPPNRATFAIIVGINQSPEPTLAPLRYADDDAARYQELFRTLGARTYLLAKLDAGTARLHPQAAAEAREPTANELRRTLDEVDLELAAGRARGVRTVLYLVYAGHGVVSGGDTMLSLERGRIAGRDLLARLSAARADEVHAVVDACHAGLLAHARGPGGRRREASGFVAASMAGQRVGLLLSTSVSGETHEWSGFEGGVFSHEVRSGLYGAADLDGDSRVTYREIAAFVARANEPVLADRFRPQVLARPPDGGDVLVDLTRPLQRSLRFEGPESAAHHTIEDTRGVRLVDFHGNGRTVQIARPGHEQLFVRRLRDGVEWVVPPGPGSVDVLALAPAMARTGLRGAAHEAFHRLFSMPFDDSALTMLAREEASNVRSEADGSGRRRMSIALWTGGALGAALGVGALALAHEQRESAAQATDHRTATARNDRLRLYNGAGVALIGVGGIAALLGAWVWPWQAGTVDVACSCGGCAARGRWTF